jgi:Cu+-exporting ATPase
MIERIDLKVSGMSCVRCQAAVENAISRLDGIKSCSVSFSSGRARIEFESEKVTVKQIEKTIKKAGYAVVLDPSADARKEFRNLLIRFIISAILALPFLFMMVLMFLFPNAHITHILHKEGLWQLIISSVVQFTIGIPFYKTAILSLINRSPGMDLLVSVGTLSAYFYSLYEFISGGKNFYFESSVIIITLILFGKMLEKKAKAKTGDAIQSLMKLTPKTATLLKDGKEITINTEDIKVGDIILIHPGESIPCDALVVSGESFADESMLTGESLPVEKKEGSTLFGGTVNRGGSLTIKAEKVGSETVLSGIIRMVEEAENSKANIQSIADKVASVFVPSVITISLITFILSLIFLGDITGSLTRAVAVLVIACPCSLGLATPTALIVGIGKGALNGILIKNADILEKSAKMTTLVTDKTGTITLGKPMVTSVFTLGDLTENKALKLAASVERFSEHPLGKAINSSYSGEYFEAENFKNDVGFGVFAEIDNKQVYIGKISPETNIPEKAKEFALSRETSGETVIYMTIGSDVAALFSVADPIKPESVEAIKELKDLNIQVVMVTGDNKRTAQNIAEKAGITNVIAEVLPDGKAEEITKLQVKGETVGMAGDGINDAPALALSDIGFAMGSGTDIALETGDVVLLGGNLSLIPKTVRLSKATMRKIKQNLFWAFFYNVIGIPLAALGLLSPIIAGAAMSLSSVSVVTNSLLLKRTKI